MGSQALHKMDVFANLNGGLNTLSTPLLSERDKAKRMMSPALRNVDMFYEGGISKRLGKTIQGSALIPASLSVTDSAYTQNVTALNALYPLTGVASICQSVVASANFSLSTLVCGIAFLNGSDGTVSGIRCVIKANSAGSPGATLASGTSTALTSVPVDTNTTTVFTFSSPPALTNGTTYWVCIEVTFAASNNFFDVRIGNTAFSGAGYKFSTDNYGTFTTTNSKFYLEGFGSTNPISQGLHDYRFGSSSTQRVMAAAGGTLFYHARNATPLTGAWTSLTTGLASGQNSLFDFKTFKNLEFSADGTNAVRVWDGAAAYTIAMGFRATFTLTDSAAAGTVPAGFYWIMPVTTLISGGYRSGAPVQIQVAGASNHQIIVGSVVMNGSGATDFGFDVNALATTWYMTAVTAATTTAPGTFYKVPVGNVSGGINPLANSATTFNITATTGLTASTTLLTDYNLEQGYFTSQITAPIAQYLAVWNGFLAVNDIANLSRLRLSSLNEPMIWSTFGGVQGAYEDLNTNDGDVINGIRVHDMFLYVFKRKYTFMVQFTSNAAAPFVVRQISASYGALSHWSAKPIKDVGIVFMSQAGPALAVGTSVDLLPATQQIANRFEPNDPSRYNLAAMAYTTAGINTTKSQVYWGVSSTSATTRDMTLVYDYANKCFWENDVSANFYAEVTDANFFPSIWSGDYSAQVFQHDSGTSDNGSAIAFNFYTPDIQIGAPYYLKRLEALHLSGAVQSSGTLSVDVYLDFSSSIAQTLTFDMTDPKFETGIAIPLGLFCKSVKLNVRNSELSVPVQVYSFGLSYSMEREAIGSA